MSNLLQWMVFIVAGLLMYLFFWRKKLVESISLVLFWVSLGFIFYSGDTPNSSLLNLGYLLFVISIIIALGQGYFSYKKSK